jgi:signal transduction histidine kinase
LTRRLAVLALAITSLVVVAFTVPLMLLVRRQAFERAQINAEREAQTVAGLVALAVAGSDQVSRTDISNVLGNLSDGVGLILPDGSELGDIPQGSTVVDLARLGEPASGSNSEGGWEVGIPVHTRSGVIAVVAVAPLAELTRGVATAWTVLVALGVLVILAAAALAMRLGRVMVRPVDQLAVVARRLGEGDLAARADGAGPPEVTAVASALNSLAERLGDLINEERESLADLSHRLRTPLTSLRLQAERVSGAEERRNLESAVDRMQEAVDGMIVAVREGKSPTRRANLASVISRRLEFWRVLASEQGRKPTIRLDTGPLPVAVGEEELGSMFDGLIGNIFAHTPAGTAFEVRLAGNDEQAVLTVGDAGPGFRPGLDPTRRGVSGGGSTGLGLDIARSIAERTGGRLRTGRSPLGGAQVELTMPIVTSLKPVEA